MDIIEIVRNNLGKKYIKKSLVIDFIWRRVCVLTNAIWSYFKLQLNKVILKQLKSKCVLINSPWGSGKTYRFKHNLQPIFENKGYRCVYISLFGIKTVDELKTKLINDCLNYKYNIFLLLFIPIVCFLIFCTYGVDLAIAFNHKIIIKFFPPIYILVFIFFLWAIFKFMKLNFIKTILFGLSNKFLGTGIPMNKSEIGELFNPYCDIFVFDDLERISDDCKIKDIMGFIADLKYIHGFNILLIGDEEHLDKENYNLYKEKLVDYEESELTITEDIFNDIIEQIENKKVKQFVIDGLKPHIDFNSIGENPITKNLRLILRCIDDITRLFNNKLLNDNNIYWFDGNYTKSLLDILKLSNNTIFIENSTVIYKIHCSFIGHYKETLSEEELEKQKDDFIGSNLQYLSHITDDDIKNEFYKNKLQILNNYCCRYIKDSISPEICNQIITNLIDCKNLLINFNEYSEYFTSFKNLCFHLNKDISNYFDLFNSITSSILKNYYNNFDKLLDLCGVHELPKEISSTVMDKINNYKFNNVIKFLKEELKIIDNRISEGSYVDYNIYHLLNEFFSSFAEVCIKNKNVFEEIDFNSYKNATDIKIFFINTLYRNIKMYFGGVNKQDIIDMINRLSKFYCSYIEKFRFDAIVKEIENLKIT